MSHEIEAKIKVDDLDRIAGMLGAAGSQFLHDLRQVDTYFMDTHRLLHKNDCGLRLRRQTIGTTTTALLTFKGARSQSRFKSRPEYETAVTDAAALEQILEALGYSKRLTFEKKRSLWRLGGCEVCLDEVPKLGCFVEVEGPDETAIEAVLRQLDLQDQPHISTGYAALLQRTLKQANAPETELYLSQQE